MTREMHLICENAQEITLQAFPIIYGKNNPYDLDRHEIMPMFREWAEEFEKWWSGHDEKWESAHDYPTEIADFTDKKVGAYLRELNFNN